MSFIKYNTQSDNYEEISGLSQNVLAKQTAGLNLINIRSILSNAKENREEITHNKLTETKKELIEAEAYGLLEFVETSYNLDNVAGHTMVKEHLRHASTALKRGRQDVLPMGYLVCGPVGTGKTFLVTCFASEVGIPMVKLKNFRSQWQGVTEGNLEKILTLLKAMAPVAVMIDEADAYLGDRDASGDSGVSSRVFSQIASFMSDTSHRGEIISVPDDRPPES
ncbi:MAG: ATP-binding protein [Balneolaceae bacterium]|nr:ATP-binding protein [Balneolaceae bacterium]